MPKLIVKREQTPETEAQVGPARLLASYVEDFERWMEKSARCRKSAEADEVRQEIRLAFWELQDTPATPTEARATFLRLASRFASPSKRQTYHQGALVHDPEGFAENAEQTDHDALLSLALFDALEQLDEEHRWIVLECKLKGRTNLDVSKEMGVSEDVARNRLWRAITQLLAILKDDPKIGKKGRNGSVIAPLAFEFTDDQCGAFWSIWKAEGRLPTYGGPPPPKPPSHFRWAPRFSSPHDPHFLAAIGGAIGGVSGVAVVVFLLSGSSPIQPEVARFGLKNHLPVAEFEAKFHSHSQNAGPSTDVAPASTEKIVDSHVTSAPTRAKSTGTSASRSHVGHDSSPPFDDPAESEGIKHLRRRVLRSFPGGR